MKYQGVCFDVNVGFWRQNLTDVRIGDLRLTDAMASMAWVWIRPCNPAVDTHLCISVNLSHYVKMISLKPIILLMNVNSILSRQY